MDLSLNLGVSPFAKAENNQAFATADNFPPASGNAPAGLTWFPDGITALTDAAGNPVDAAMLAGAFRALVDQLMSDVPETADDAAPAAGRSVASEADDLAATLKPPSEGDDPESSEIRNRPETQVWLVELEVISRAAGVHAASPTFPTEDRTKRTPEAANEHDDVQTQPVSTISSLLSGSALTAAPIAPANVPANAYPVTDSPLSAGALAAPEESPASSSVVKGVPSSGAGQPMTSAQGMRAAGPTDAQETTPDTIADSRPGQRQTPARAAAPATEDTPTASAAARTTTASAIQPSEADVQRSQFSSPQPGVAQNAPTNDREAGSGSAFTTQRAGAAKPEGATQPAEPLQAFMPRESAPVSKLPEPVSEDRAERAAPRSAATSVTRIDDRAPIAAPRTASNESWDTPQRGRHPEPHQPLARAIAADVQAVSLPMASGAHELPIARLAPASSSPIVGAPAVTEPAMSENTASQIVQAIRLQVTRGGGEATIRLEPKHFGELSITVRVDQGQVSARLQAESPVVREYLHNHQNLLRESLADQQLTLGKFEVAEPPADSRNSERRSPDERAFAGDRHPQRRRQPSPDTPFEPFEVIA